MNSVYVVRAIPLRHRSGRIVGWVRVDVLADGSSPNDAVYLSDGSACGQAETVERVAADHGLLYPTQAEAVRDGIARLRKADAKGETVPLRSLRG